jgi:hypothetical protein
MKDNDRLFAMRNRAEKTLALIKLMNETFPDTKDENVILAVMASNFDSFWEGWNWRGDVSLGKTQKIMEDFCNRFYASDHLDDMEVDIRTFLQGYKYE